MIVKEIKKIDELQKSNRFFNFFTNSNPNTSHFEVMLGKSVR